MVREDCEIKEIDDILDEAIMNAKPHYLIKWKNQPHQFDTWQPIQNLVHINTELTEWIKKRRRYHSSNHNRFGNSASKISFRHMKRRNIKKRQHRPRHVPSNQIIVLDEEYDNVSNENIQVNNEKDCRSKSKKLLQDFHEEINESKGVYHPSEPPQKLSQNDQNHDKKSQMVTSNKEGMKIVGRVKREDIKQIDKVFMWKGNRCFKIKLTNGKVTNMRQEDLKLLCPEMLLDFYEGNQIDF